ncbi:hypothetical protein NX722_12420 [Endozoicomonas gorgoniicola]|uniref:Putative adhesin Stv domain-containing protein n=1 Tax=Endozoicomonas gorgoniicola TaxID=1234144 RepID=A0ABT3MWR8_9GAMM|nr:hypothetical protein [Endozoicomonas gorgoniicola]MCW7553424.1 hypothetical protein [Endozoicomonas gorgoniicola]
MNPINKPRLHAPIHKTLIAGKFNLFTSDTHGDNVQNLLILAHSIPVQSYSISGVFRRIIGTHSFSVPGWTTLIFYAPHGYVLKTPNIENFMMGLFPPLESAMPGETVINYGLRYKNTQYPLANDAMMQIYFETSRFSPFCPYFSQHPFRIFDVITTQPSDPEGSCLSELIETLYRTNHTYPRIHCIFCRNEYGGKKRIYEPGYHNPPFSQP